MLREYGSARSNFAIFRSKQPLPYFKLNQRLASAVARLRTRTHQLASETDRHLPPDERTCNHCHMPESEEHAILECPLYTPHRLHLRMIIGELISNDSVIRSCLSPAGPHGALYAAFLAKIWKQRTQLALAV